MKKQLFIFGIFLITVSQISAGTNEADALTVYQAGKFKITSQVVNKINDSSKDVFCIRSLKGGDPELGVKDFSFEVANVGKNGKCGDVARAIADTSVQELGTFEELKNMPQSEQDHETNKDAGAR